MKANINGEEVSIRPLHATDTAMEAAFVRALSVQARRYRFFGSVRELSAAELKLLCDVGTARTPWPSWLRFNHTVRNWP